MSRARNIKPAFFANEELGECSPLARLLFIGLWTIADFKGDLEWRPKRIKAQLLPYDQCEVEALASELVAAGMVKLYAAKGVECLTVVNFAKHQNPHKNEKEKGSTIPSHEESDEQAIDFQALTINHDKSGAIESNREQDGIAPADSLFLKPDPLILKPDSVATVVAENPELSGKPAPSSKKGRRWGVDEVVPNEWKTWALEQGIHCEVITEQSERFADYWKGVAGAKGVKLDWEATWRNWIRRVKEQGQRSSYPTTSSRPTKYQQQMADQEAMIARFMGTDQHQGHTYEHE